MPRESRAADQRRLAEEHARGVGQGRKAAAKKSTPTKTSKAAAKKSTPTKKTSKTSKTSKAAAKKSAATPKRRGRPRKTDAERADKAWDVLRTLYTESAIAAVGDLKRVGFGLDDLVAMELAELIELKARLKAHKGPATKSYVRLVEVAQQCRKQLMRLLVLSGGTNVNDVEIRVPEGLEILERPVIPVIGDDVLAKPDLSRLPERYR